MKGIVVETKDGCSAVLREDGTFERVDGVFEIGASIEMTTSGEMRAAARKKTRKRRLVQRVAAAAVALMILAGSGWNYMTVQACTTVTLEGSASIEYTLNRLDRVISVTAGTEEDEEIVAQLEEKQICSMNLADAMDLTKEVLEEEERLTDDAPCEVRVESKDEKRASRLEEDAKQVLGQPSGKESPADGTMQAPDDGQNPSAAEAGPQGGKGEVPANAPGDGGNNAASAEEGGNVAGPSGNDGGALEQAGEKPGK